MDYLKTKEELESLLVIVSNPNGRLYATVMKAITRIAIINCELAIEEVKPPRQWSEKELMLFKLLPDWAKWIAKDQDADICIYESKPTKSNKIFTTNSKDEYDYKILDVFDFLTITFEESPIYIGDLKGE